MNDIQKRDSDFPAIHDDSFIRDVVQRHLGSEPKRENNFLSNIFSKRVTNNFIRLKVYHHCTFYLGREED